MNKILNFNIITKILSRNLFILSGALFVNSIVSVCFSERYLPFIFSSVIAFTVGSILFALSRNNNIITKLQRKDAYLTVTLSWLLISFIGCLPYVLSGAIPSFINAFFESISGFTTTGSSILTDIEALPKSILFWRSMTHWIGGIGIIVLVIILMPTLQIGGYHLFNMESSLQEKIKPKIKSVGIRLLLIYISLTFIEIVFLKLGGMNLFESICHAFGTVSTGGFSPKNTSISEYSAYIQYVVMVFMLLSGTNFVIYYYLIKREFHKIKANDEFKFYFFVVFLIGSIITSVLFFEMNKPIEESFREGFFQVISIITCTGFASADYLLWPGYAWAIIFFAMFLGGCTGSTAGGIKMIRHLIVFRNLAKLFKQMINPNAIIPIRINNYTLSDENNTSLLIFVANYFAVFLIGSLILILFGIDGKTASSSVASCMANIGPGIGTIGPASNFAHLPDAVKIILSFIMLVGRLEIYTVLILFSSYFWKS